MNVDLARNAISAALESLDEGDEEQAREDLEAARDALREGDDE